MMDRVLSAACHVWMEGWDKVHQGRETLVTFKIVEALADRSSRIQWQPRKFPAPADVSNLVLVAGGSRTKFVPEMVAVPACSAPILQVRGVVTTAREPKLEGHLIRARGDVDSRRWLFVVGVDPYRLATETGLFPDPVVDEAGFIPTPADKIRDRRKELLGFDGEGA